MKVTAVLVAVVLAAGICSVLPAAEQDQQKAEEAKRKADEAKKKADEARKKADEEQKKRDDPKHWPARDFASAAAIPGAVCVYIKDPKAKKSHEIEVLEGKEMVGNEEVRIKLRAFNRIKIKDDGSDGKGWPPEWLAKAKNGAVLVLFNSDPGADQSKNAVINKALSKDAMLKQIGVALRYDAELKAAREARAKEVAVRNPPPEKKPELPGLDIQKPAKDKDKDKEKDKKKPGSKEPQDE
jgi:hypothetical protein